MPLRCGPVTVERLGPTTVRLAARTGVVVYLDPAGDVGEPRDGDLVLVTERPDPDAIARIAREDALVAIPEGIDPSGLDRPVERVAPGESFLVGPLDLHTTPAGGADGRATGCGYALTMDGVTAFWPGRTAVFDSHRTMSVDLLLAPVGLEGAMDRRAAADLAETLDLDLVVPVGSESAVDVESFVVDVATRGIPIALEPPAES
ncbi:MBL fold metallo-hydrolase [Saliphagus infecundisoli]|uniref:MBL fold metallo-hydrolase n=1 Tax=Saliphagus infecundisoli TaxID=1849069 RepID=A0ABD5QFX9_9EURY|nr:MBL fold metallo-hydrolase [Saliphagus infecundisoli]